MSTTGDHTFTPPYLPFSTFIGFLDKLGEHDIPPRIDRSVMDSMSGTTQSFLLAALRSFDLVGENFEVRPTLERLALNPDERPQLIGDLLRHYYAEQIKLGTETATSGQLAESFRNYDLSGETVRKAIRFFLHAAEFAGIKLSPYFKPPGTTAASAGRVGGRRRARAAKAPTVQRPTRESVDGHSQTIELRSGGSLTLTMSVNLFDLSTEDRAFILELVDKVRTYDERATATDEFEDAV
ncbi:MAG: hypothetical protein LC808_17640 [Actinobacteria bacterium]|nr:hypothetical protein [Actinomycetota bacterium]